MREPVGNSSICLQRRKRHTTKATFAMDEHAFVVAEVAEFVRFDFVFFGFGVVHVALAGAESPRAFHHALFADEIGGLNGVAFVGGAEDEPVAEIEREHFRFVRAEWRNERCRPPCATR